jgi:hypothetical protein
VSLKTSTWLAALVLVALSLSIPPAVASTHHKAAKAWTSGMVARVQNASDALTIRKTVTRDYFTDVQASTDAASGEVTYAGTSATDTRNITVAVDKHTNLQSRERIQIAWSGAHPSGGRALNPYGEKGLTQEYPMLILECRGTPDQVTPDTCWTQTFQQRSIYKDKAHAIWLHDKDATADDTAHVSGMKEADVPSSCPLDPDNYYHFTPFKAVGGDAKTFSACSAANMPPEATGDSVDPANEIAAFTNTDGTGLADFEVRTSTENSSLGCSSSQPCTLEIIPIMGISCADADPECNKTGAFAPGSSNVFSQAPEDAVSPAYWWSSSNWKNRIAVPLTLAQPPSVCQLLNSSPAVPFFGSELLSQAALQWTPAYCLNKSRFNWQQNTMPDDAAFQQMSSGTGAAAEVSGRREEDTGVGYAPTALTGWGIAFNVDKPGNAGQQMTLNLNARLIAKLLTASYPGSPLSQTHPGIDANPYTMNLDPEFQQLNPGLDATHFGDNAYATLLSLSTSSDVIYQLSSYIAADPSAMAFIHGQADPWGMKVNPYYKNVSLPVSTWPLLDQWVPTKTGQSCIDENKSPYMLKIASPVSSFRLIATAMLFNWPMVTGAPTCSFDQVTQVSTPTREPAQGLGNRFMFGVVTLADAARYGLTVANLQAAPGHYVAANAAGIGSALALAHQPKPRKKATAAEKRQSAMRPYVLDQKDVRKSSTAYPGTMVVYTAAKTWGMVKTTAKQVSQFIKVSTTEGQVPGRGNGQLPDGYVPIVNSGVTKKLFATAQTVAKAVLAQQAPKTPASPTTTAPAGATSPSSGSSPLTTPPATVPASSTATVPAVAPATGTPQGSTVTARTANLSSSVGGGLLPLLLLGGLAAGLVSAVTRLVLRVRGVR